MPVMPMFESIVRSMSWLTVSKAADRSSRISAEDFPSALAALKASVTDSKAVSVEWPLLKPDCFGSSRSFLVRKSVTCFATALSTAFDRNGSSEIGR